MPVRIQRSRKKGWKLPAGAEIVDRTSIFGNPFVVSTKMKPGTKIGAVWITVPTAEDAVACYREMLTHRPDLVERIKRDLRGKDLACFCALDAPCHAEILLEIANA